MSWYGSVTLTSLYDAKFFSSRLLGENIYFANVGAVIEIDLINNNQEIANTYNEVLSGILASLPIEAYEIKIKVFKQGINVALSYPYDLLMVACEILDWTWEEVVDLVDNATEVDFAKAQQRFTTIIQDQQNLILRKIYIKSHKEKVNLMIDKKWLILGSGYKQFRVKLSQVTKLSDIPWKKIGDIPIALITGTNGKTTTTRLTEFICRDSAKLYSGYSSTDWISINKKTVKVGDFSGPTGHQYVLQHPKMEIAILEVARGGMLKRGLLPVSATVATITNIANDHLGQSGIENLTDLAAAKGLIYAGLKQDGVAVINLDDEHISKLPIDKTKVYLSTKLSASKMAPYLNPKNFVVYLENDHIILETSQKKHQLNKIDEIPLTVNGLASYNNENILHAVSLSFVLGIKPKQISCGLKKFGRDNESNFGRWNYYNLSEKGHFVVDVAHNPAGLESLITLARKFRNLHKLKGKLGLMYGNTADRKEMIPEIVDIIIRHQVDKVIIKEFQQSLRGSKLGEMTKLFYDELIKAGYPIRQVKIIANELEATKYITSKSKADDMFLLCAHDLLPEVSKLMKSLKK